jgi:hypothetical protein
MASILQEADNALLAVQNWQNVLMPEAPPNLKPRAYKGSANGWTFLVVSFSIEDQGFPKGSRGYDGTGTRSAMGMPVTVMHLPRDLAEKAVKLALRQLRKKP